VKTIVHLSDLHFGRIDTKLIEPLLKVVREAQPDLAIISGDLTQRARAAQFRAARDFLDRLQCAWLVVPGNHDIPLYNAFARFMAPLHGYKRFITSDLYPIHEDNELAVMGLNTARSFATDRGSIDDVQVERAEQYFATVPDSKVKIMVTHHPFDIPDDLSSKYVLRKAARAMEVLSKCKADLFLAGHAHTSFAESSIRRYRLAKHASLIVQAGTGLSTRTRTTPNSFNLLRLDRRRALVEHWFWFPGGDRFSPSTIREFHYAESGWTPAEITSAA
jgi:3',5'-cyclic AMP phosphodiesterase CpdA